jgi:hypothetical protein
MERERVYYYGNFARDWDTESYIARAFERLGHEVKRVDCTKVAVSRMEVHAWEPTLFLCSIPQLHQLDEIAVLSGSGIFTACWHFDLLHPEYSQKRYGWATQITSAVRLFATTDGSTAPLLKGSAVVKVVRQGVPDDTRKPQHRDDFVCSVAHVGGLYGVRSAWWLSLKRRFGSLAMAFNNVRGGDLSDLAACAATVIGPAYPSRPGYWSNRIYAVVGNGACFVAPMVPGMEQEGWLPGKHFIDICDASEDSVVDAIRSLGHPSPTRKSVRQCGQDFAQLNFSYDRRVQQLLNEINLIRNQ